MVPLVTLGLWWLLNHTRFGDQVRAAASNADLARMTGISPKLVSTAVWSIAGFLSAMAVLLTATERGSTELISIGPETLLRGLAAALIGGMVSFPRAALGAVLIGVGERLLSFHYPSETGLVQFVLLVLVVVLVARVSRREQAGGESFQFTPRIPCGARTAAEHLVGAAPPCADRRTRPCRCWAAEEREREGRDGQDGRELHLGHPTRAPPGRRGSRNRRGLDALLDRLRAAELDARRALVGLHDLELDAAVLLPRRGVVAGSSGQYSP